MSCCTIRRFASLTLASLLTLGAAACAGDDIGSGAEYATDSFSSPTEHGQLYFGGRNAAEFTEDNRFHAWTFSLTDAADVELTTVLGTDNLDTVMYLYRLGEDGSWGSYIEKNDDYDGLLASRISGQLEAGEYRLKIKATKLAMRGSFNVSAQCAGAGCPVVDPGTCSGDGPANLPQPTGYTTACDATFMAILTTPTMAAPPDCAEALKERAVQYYKDYWDEIYGYDELTGGDPDAEPYVGAEFHPGAGVVIDIGMGGDEDAMDFVFDLNGKLLYYYQHNQSPDWGWYCAADGEEPMEEPDEDCFREPISQSDYDVEDVSEASGTTPAGETPNLPPQVAAAVTEYVEVEAVGNGEDVAYDYALWAGYYTNGAEVTLSAPNRPEVTYVVTGEPDWGMTIVFRIDSSGPSYVCKELPRQ
jgi:hypothetical protein